jgi:hypothetical protein
MIQDDVIDLMLRLKPLQSSLKLVPATEDELHAFEMAHSVKLPCELRELFRRCNGANVNPGGLESLYWLDWHFKQYPKWKEAGWYPVASDGSGDLYFLNTTISVPSTGTHPVCYMDQTDFSKLNYVMASGLWRFLHFLFEDEYLSQSGIDRYWPFDREKVMEFDPEIEACGGKGLPLPWELEDFDSPLPP